METNEKEAKKLNPVLALVAERLHKLITEQVKWIETQDKLVTAFILTGNTNGNAFDLRQNVQALETGKNTLASLKNHFEAAVEMSYDEYCKGINVATVLTTEERLVKTLLSYVDERIAQVVTKQS